MTWDILKLITQLWRPHYGGYLKCMEKSWMLWLITISVCEARHSFRSRQQTSQRMQWRRYNDFRCTQSLWYFLLFFPIELASSNFVMDIWSKYHSHGQDQMPWWKSWMLINSMSIKHGGRNTKVRDHFPFLLIKLTLLYTETTRYTNPLKSKFRAKRLAAESKLLSILLTYLLLIRGWSRWRSSSTCPQTSKCTNARRISPTKQDSLSPKSSGKRHKRPTSCSFFSVSLPFMDAIIITSRNSSSLDTPTYTRFVLSQPNEILRLWSSWTKGALVWRKMHYTIINWMGRTRSRYALLVRYTFSTLIFLNPLISRLRSQGSSYGCTFVSHFVVSPIIYNIQQSSTFAVVNLMTGTYWSIVQYHPAWFDEVEWCIM